MHLVVKIFPSTTDSEVSMCMVKIFKKMTCYELIHRGDVAQITKMARDDNAHMST